MIEQQDRQLSTGKGRVYYGYIILIACFCIILAAFGARAAFGVFFKPILSELGWSNALTSGAYSLSVIVEGMLAIVVGGLTDKFGPRVVLTICGLLLGLGFWLMSLINSAWQFP
jgi:cyanate permease